MVNENLQEKVAKLRKANKWTVRRLAKEAGVDHVTILNAERGQGITILTLQKIADALGKPAWWFLR